MGEQNELDFNDLMFEIHINEQHQEQEIAHDNDGNSDLGSSLSNFGIDRDNPEENQRYIQENQNPHAIIQGIGLPDMHFNINLVDNDSGLASSITNTRNSEFIPEIIEHYTIELSSRNIESIPEMEDNEKQDDSSSTICEINEATEIQPGPSSSTKYNSKYDVPEEMAQTLQELDMPLSTHDLALERGYYKQAIYAYEYATSNGSQVITKYSKSLHDMHMEGRKKWQEMEKVWKMVLNDNSQYYKLEKCFADYIKTVQEKLEWERVLKKCLLNKRKDVVNSGDKDIDTYPSFEELKANIRECEFKIQATKDDILSHENNYRHLLTVSQQDAENNKDYQPQENEEKTDFVKDNASNCHE